MLIRSQSRGDRLRLVSAAIGALVAGCASPAAEASFPPNPISCDAVVAQHRADPSLAVDQAARPRSVSIPGRLNLRGRVVVAGVVDEDGRLIAGTTRVTGTEDSSAIRQITAAFERATFEPARVGQCRVAGPVQYAFEVGD